MWQADGVIRQPRPRADNLCFPAAALFLLLWLGLMGCSLPLAQADKVGWTETPATDYHVMNQASHQRLLTQDGQAGKKQRYPFSDLLLPGGVPGEEGWESWCSGYLFVSGVKGR